METKVNNNQAIFCWEFTAGPKWMDSATNQVTNKLWAPTEDHKSRRFILRETENN